MTLVFIGGAAGKLACGWIGHWLGNVATIAICQTAHGSRNCRGLAAAAAAYALVVLPFVGLVLNGVTTVIYGSVPNYAAPERRTHALSVFYTITIGAAAVAPPAGGLIGDLIGIPSTVVVVSVLTLATIPLRFCSRTRAAWPLSEVARCWRERAGCYDRRVQRHRPRVARSRRASRQDTADRTEYRRGNELYARDPADAVIPGRHRLLRGVAFGTQDRRFPAPPNDLSPHEAFARFGADEWDALRQRLREGQKTVADIKVAKVG